MGDLTKNFSAAEFDKPEPVPVEYRGNIPALADRCQWLRDLAGSIGEVTDTYRSAAHNAEIPNAAKSSQHMLAEASDVEFTLCPIRTLAERALASIADGDNPPFGQLIFYSVRGHVHVSVPNAALLGSRNGQVLHAYGIDENGQDLFEPLIDPETQMPLLSTAQKKRGLGSHYLSSSHSSARSGGAGNAAHAGGKAHGKE